MSTFSGGRDGEDTGDGGVGRWDCWIGGERREEGGRERCVSSVVVVLVVMG